MSEFNIEEEINNIKNGNFNSISPIIESFSNGQTDLLNKLSLLLVDIIDPTNWSEFRDDFELFII